MATLTNSAQHSTTLANGAIHSASTTTNQPAHTRFGDYTMAQLAAFPISRFADDTFDTPLTIMTNETAH